MNTLPRAGKPVSLKQQQAEEARQSLLKFCPPGARVYCVLRHVSKSGMSRVIQLVVNDATDGHLVQIGHWAARLLDWRFDCDKNGVKVTGAGMDMGFHLVYTLSSALYGYDAEGKYCQEGAYSLKHEWL